MGKHRDRTDRNRSKTLPSSPSHSFSSSSSSDFEFTIAVSPRKSSAALCPADELFYKGQLLPLHLSPRISMVRTLLLSSSSTSSSATASASRDSTGSSSSTDSSTSSFASDLALLAAGVEASCDSSRPSSVAEDDSGAGDLTRKLNPNSKSTKPASKNYFSLSRFSNVFKKDPKSAVRDPEPSVSVPIKRTSSSAKEVIRKYLKKVKPLYEKLSQKQQQQQQQQRTTTTSSGTSSSNAAAFCSKTPSIAASANRSATAPGVDQEIMVVAKGNDGNYSGNLSHSFSGNLGYPRRTRRSCVASCPSSMRSSPSHSGVLSKTGFTGRAGSGSATTSFYSDNSTMEELQSAIQGAIAHCKNSMLQSNKASTSKIVRVGISNEI